jgi:hypothetical protein
MSSTLVLRTAMDIRKYKNVHRSPVSSNSDRISEYKNGVSALSKLVSLAQFESILLVDNTLERESQETDLVRSYLPANTKLVLTGTNRFGQHNKGAGDVETYRYLSKEGFLKNDFLVHYEPRLILKSSTFFDKFFSNPRTILTLSPNGLGIQTGYMSFETKNLIEFCSIKRLLRMTVFNQSIENEMLQFAHKKELEISANLACTYRIDPITKQEIPY